MFWKLNATLLSYLDHKTINILRFFISTAQFISKVSFPSSNTWRTPPRCRTRRGSATPTGGTAARPPLSLGEGEVLVALVEGAAAEAGLALPLRGCSTNQFNFKLNTEIVLEYCSKALIPRCLKRITAPSFTIISHFTTTLIFNLLMMFY